MLRETARLIEDLLQYVKELGGENYEAYSTRYQLIDEEITEE